MGSQSRVGLPGPVCGADSGQLRDARVRPGEDPAELAGAGVSEEGGERE